jgi:hypothetical protein
MTKEQFEKKTNELYKKGILYLNKENCYAYEMNLEKDLIEKIESIFSPYYFEDKLYKLIVTVKQKDMFSTPDLMQIMLVKLFSKKYGYDYIVQKGVISNDYIFIHGNREIKIIVAIGEDRIFYTDLSVQKKIDKSEDEKSNKNINDTKSNL